MKYGIIILLFIITGCCSTSQVEKPAPGWIDKIPFEKGVVQSVGVSGPTYFREEAIVKAADAARNELAKSLAGRIQSVLLIKENENNTSMSQAYIVSATAWSQDVVMVCSQIVATWVDEKGTIGNDLPGTTYALARLELNKVPLELENFAKKNQLSPQEIEDIQARAKNEFLNK